jgi:hypothetical protein
VFISVWGKEGSGVVTIPLPLLPLPPLWYYILRSGRPLVEVERKTRVHMNARVEEK